MISNLNPKKRKKKKKRRNPTRPFGKFRVAPPPQGPISPPSAALSAIPGSLRKATRSSQSSLLLSILSHHHLSPTIRLGGWICLFGRGLVGDHRHGLTGILYGARCARLARPLRYGTGDQSTTLYLQYGVVGPRWSVDSRCLFRRAHRSPSKHAHPSLW